MCGLLRRDGIKMNITIVAIGKKHDAKLSESITEYSERLSHYIKLEWKLLEVKITSSMLDDQIKNLESELLFSAINSADRVILLDERGAQFDSPTLAIKIQSLMNQSTKNLVIVIGGAFGVNENLMQRADFIWSFSKLVFPHQLVRLILVEQLYRAHTILAGEKYHHI